MTPVDGAYDPCSLLRPDHLGHDVRDCPGWPDATYRVRQEGPGGSWWWGCLDCGWTGWELGSEQGARREATRHQRMDCRSRVHTRTAHEDGPDYCAECSEAAQEWRRWPCPAMAQNGD